MTDDERIAALIADRLVNGITHPGSVEEDQPPMLMRLPMFRTVGVAPEVHQQVDMTVKLIAEAIVHLIHTDGHIDFVAKENE